MPFLLLSGFCFPRWSNELSREIIRCRFVDVHVLLVSTLLLLSGSVEQLMPLLKNLGLIFSSMIVFNIGSNKIALFVSWLFY